MNPQVLVPGEHSGLANLIPGNPGQVDPPSLDRATPSTGGGTLAAGQYVYAVTDQFNTAAPGQTPVAAAGESAASVSSPVVVSGTGSVALSWGAVCHAGVYNVYRAPYTPGTGTAAGTIGAWSLIGTVNANTEHGLQGSDRRLDDQHRRRRRGPEDVHRHRPRRYTDR